MDVLKSPDTLRVDLKGQAGSPGAAGHAFWQPRRRPDVHRRSAARRCRRAACINCGRSPARPRRARARSRRTRRVARRSSPPCRPAPPRPDAFGVTIEPAGGSPTPTLPIVLIGTSRHVNRPETRAPEDPRTREPEIIRPVSNGAGKPKVVVVMPAYNAARTIEKTWREVIAHPEVGPRDCGGRREPGRDGGEGARARQGRDARAHAQSRLRRQSEDLLSTRPRATAPTSSSWSTRTTSTRPS